MTTIYLIRHAEAEGNLYRRIQGWYNSLITENGFRQIQALEERFRDIPIDAVYSSDLYRTMTTAQAICKPKGLPLVTDPGLREIHLGDWEDETWGYVRHFDEKEMLRFNRSDYTWRAPNGENLLEVGNRLLETICRLAINHPDQTIAMFSHSAAIRQALTQIKGLAPEHWDEVGHGDNTAVTKLIFDDYDLSIEYESDSSHLPSDLSTLAKQAWWRKDNLQHRDISLWFRPADWAADREFYLAVRQERWAAAHPHGPAFDPEDCQREARLRLEHQPRALTIAMAGDQPIGVLELDEHWLARDGIGYLPFCATIPEFRPLGLEIQLIGEAVSFYRPLGRDRLRLCCSPAEEEARRYFTAFGFSPAPDAPELLEKYIGFDR